MIINMVVTYLSLEQLPQQPMESAADASSELEPTRWWQRWL